MAVDSVDFPASPPTGLNAGVYPIPLVTDTIAGFIGRTDRGPVDEPVVVRSFSEFCHFFGGHCAVSLVSHAVQDYFLHGGGRAVIVRVANRATRGRIDVPAGKAFLHLQARQPGRQEVLRVSIDYEKVESEPNRFNLVVQRLRSSGSSLIADQELYPQLSIEPADERFIIDAIRDSKLVGVTGPLPETRPDATLPERPGDPMGYVDMATPGTDGEELTDYDIVGSNKNGTGLFSFRKGPHINLLCIPPSPTREMGMTALLAAERYCAGNRALLIMDPPRAWENADRAIMAARQLDFGSRNIMTYFPRIRPRGERARFAAGLPACGAIAGMLAHADKRGIWHANNEYLLKTSLTAVEDLTPRQAAQLQRAGINTFVRTLGSRTRLEGNSTLGGSSFSSRVWRQLDRRRVYAYILDSIEEAGAWAADHYTDEVTMQTFERRVRDFLAALHERGAVDGATPAQAFFVHASPAGSERDGFVLRFGISLDRRADFIEGEIEVAPGEPARVRQSPVVEAEQLFS